MQSHGTADHRSSSPHFQQAPNSTEITSWKSPHLYAAIILLQRCPPALQQQPTAPVNSAYIISLPSVGRCALCGKLAPFISILCIPPLHGKAPAASLTTARPRPYRRCRSQGARDVDWLNLQLKQTNRQTNTRRAGPYFLSRDSPIRFAHI